MGIKKILSLGVFCCLLSSQLIGDQFYGGLGVSVTPGESRTEVSRFPISVAYETTGLWRFSYTDTEFKYDDSSSYLNSTILAAEKMWVNKVKKGFTLIGAFGPGFFSTKNSGNSSGTGTAFGMLATGSLRFALDENSFIQTSFQFKNAAVTLNGSSANAGYQGLFLSYGLFF